MIIDVMKMQGAALYGDEQSALDYRIGRDDPTITYEEFVLYYMCRCSSGYEYLDPDDQYRWWNKDGSVINIWWSKLAASKTHKREITHNWDEIFPKYKEKIGEEDFERFRKLSNKDLGLEGEIVGEETR